MDLYGFKAFKARLVYTPVPSQPGLHNETLCQKTNKPKKVDFSLSIKIIKRMLHRHAQRPTFCCQMLSR